MLILSLVSTGCSKFLEIDPPKSRMNKQTIFFNEGTAKGALTGLYAKIYEFGNGYRNSVGVYAGLSADELTYLMIDNLAVSYASEEINQNRILPDNTNVKDLWAAFYNAIYAINSFIEGIEQQGGNFSGELRASLTGEALFLRSFTYFYLVNLFGEVPLVTSTAYQINSLLPKSRVMDVYGQIVHDLKKAETLLGDHYVGRERTRVNRAVTQTFMARVFLYLEDWEQAEYWSSKVIDSKGLYQLESDLNRVFLKDSKEVIWQVTRIGNTQNAYDAMLFIQNSWHVLSPGFVEMFHVSPDQRSSAWLFQKDLGRNLYIPYKYRAVAVDGTTEHSVIMRLAEQYFIRAEARLKQGNIPGAIADLDMIRQRAGLPILTSILSSPDESSLMEVILEERKRELFTEWGHRWFDLKRTGKAMEILSNLKPGFTIEDEWYPIPESERLKNPNL